MRSLLLLPVLTFALHGQESPLSARVQAAPRLRVDALRQLQGELALETNPAKGYYEGLLDYEIVAQTRDQDPEGAEALLNRSLAAIRTRKDPESLALQAALLGLKIGFEPSAAMSLGPRVESLFDEARDAAPGSPRVLLLQGINVLHTPAFFGGGADAALPILQAAVKAA
ncbi:MAG TPA: hypothetical protein VL181_01605, partial [Holophagaceae bacterium]|nr:hypothetical protein [Holophagaceae bacterium]